MAEGGEPSEVPSGRPAGEQDSGWWDSWGKGWYDSIKEKSSATLELVQKDLNEFVSTIQHDTAVVVVDTAEKVEEKVQPAENEEESAAKAMKKGLSRILTTVSDSLKTMTVEDDKTEERQVLLDSASFAAPDLDAKQSRIYAIQTNPATFSEDPHGSLETFENWVENDFNIADKQSEMSSLLVETPEVRAIYTKLVPESVPHAIFWQRYFYKLHQVDLEEQRRAALIARVRTESGDDAIDDWGDDDDACSPSKNDKDSEVTKKVESHTTPIDDPVVTNEPLASKVETNDHMPPKKSDINADTTKPLCPKDESKVPDPLNNGSSSESKRNVSDSMSVNRDNLGNTEAKKDHEESNGSVTPQSIPIVSLPSSISPLPEELPASGETTSPSDVLPTLPPVRPGSGDSHKRPSSESVSSGSWESIDDNGLKVKTSKHPHHVSTPAKSPDITEVGSVASSGVLINREDARSEDWEDLRDDSDELELDGDISEEELNKLVQQAKEKAKDGISAGQGTEGIDDEDDDWENWE